MKKGREEPATLRTKEETRGNLKRRKRGKKSYERKPTFGVRGGARKTMPSDQRRERVLRGRQEFMKSGFLSERACPRREKKYLVLRAS